MAWIESHQTVGHHPKTIRFAELLRISLPTAVGHLHYFWWWALDFAPLGEIRTTASVVARACEWRGNAERFLQALVTAGFVEVEGDALTIHDWLDYAGRLVEKRAANRERQRRHRNGENGVTSRVTNALVTGLPTGPNQPDQPETRSSSPVPTNQPDQPNPPNPPSDQPKGGAPPTGAMDEEMPRNTNGHAKVALACCPDFARTGAEHWQYCPNAQPVVTAE